MIKGSDTATLLKNDFHSCLRKSPLWGGWISDGMK